MNFEKQRVMDSQVTQLVTSYPYVLGAVCFQLTDDSHPTAFCLTSPQHYLYVEKNGADEEWWLETLRQAIREMHVTHLYVVGKKVYDDLMPTLFENFVVEENILTDLRYDFIEKLRYKCRACNSFDCIRTLAKCSMKRKIRRMKFHMEHTINKTASEKQHVEPEIQMNSPEESKQGHENTINKRETMDHSSSEKHVEPEIQMNSPEESKLDESKQGHEHTINKRETMDHSSSEPEIQMNSPEESKLDTVNTSKEQKKNQRELCLEYTFIDPDI